MKLFTPILLASYLLMTSGCISTHLVRNKAKPHSEVVSDATEQHPAAAHTVQVEGQPAYYALLPFTAAADIATSPFQLLFYVLVQAGGAPL